LTTCLSSGSIGAAAGCGRRVSARPSVRTRISIDTERDAVISTQPPNDESAVLPSYPNTYAILIINTSGPPSNMMRVTGVI
jgi:hypothetical protein